MSKSAKAILAQIIAAEDVIERWDKDMYAPPDYPRRKLVEQLRACGQAAVNTLLAELERGDPLGKREAAKLIGDLGPSYAELVVEPLRKAVRDTHYWVRSNAARALARVEPQAALDDRLHLQTQLCVGVFSALRGRPQLGDAIEAMLRSEDRLPRHTALRAITPELLERPGVLEGLVATLDYENRNIASHAARLLAKLGGDEAGDPLLEAAKRRLELLSAPVATRLAAHPRSRELVDVLLGILPGDLDRDEEQAIQALIEVLGSIDTGELPRPDLDRLVKCLITCLDREIDYRRRPRSAAVLGETARACGQVADPRLLDALVATLDRPGGFGDMLGGLVDAFRAYGDAAQEQLRSLAGDLEVSQHERRFAERILREIGRRH